MAENNVHEWWFTMTNRIGSLKPSEDAEGVLQSDKLKSALHNDRNDMIITKHMGIDKKPMARLWRLYENSLWKSREFEVDKELQELVDGGSFISGLPKNMKTFLKSMLN
jgi:hypothetical protein